MKGSIDHAMDAALLESRNDRGRGSGLRSRAARVMGEKSLQMPARFEPWYTSWDRSLDRVAVASFEPGPDRFDSRRTDLDMKGMDRSPGFDHCEIASYAGPCSNRRASLIEQRFS
jgi:hypothetical protein